MTAEIVRAIEDGWLVYMHVMPDRKVGPGDALFEMQHEKDGGVPFSYRSNNFGVVRPYEEVDIFPVRNSGAEPIRIKKGEPLFLIASPLDGKEAGTIKGLTPRPTTVIARRRARQLNLQ